MSSTATVSIQPGSALAARPRLFAALEAAFPVKFRPFSDDLEAGDGLISFVVDGRLPSYSEPERRGCSVLLVGGDPSAAGDHETVELLDVPALDRRLRNIVLADRFIFPSEGFRVDDACVLASAPSGPVWTMRPGAGPVHRVRSVLPELEPDQVLWSLLSQRAIAALALVQFLRSVSPAGGWRPPPLRAAFLFDDPNLRWQSYGFLSYRQLLEHADANGYHTTIAMIPLDAGRPHPLTADLFAKRRDRLSLVFHGNNHVERELLVSRHEAAAVALAAQARRRIASFERRTGLAVDRVMTPPHGLCSEPMARALAATGFDALAGLHPLPWTERRPPEDALAGWRVAEFVGGCAVFPRIPLGSTAASIALRAFLDHPIVLYGHHRDLADGLGPLAAAAAVVNRLGDVRWTSVGEIAMTNAELRMADELAIVRPYSRRVRLAVGPEMRAVSVQAPPDLLEDGGLVGWSLRGGPLVAFGAEAPIPQGDDLVVRLHGARDVDPECVEAPTWRPWPKLRRVVTEARDRALPRRASVKGESVAPL